MTRHFDDLVIGGVMLAPILSYGAMAVFITLVLQLVLRRIGFARLVAAPAVAEFGLFVSIFSLMILLA